MKNEKRKYFAAALFFVFIFAAKDSDAQRRQFVRIREQPLVRFDWECTQVALYPKAKIDKLIRRQLPKDWPASSVWGDRAYTHDLNGDRVKEFFVPLYCGATGNCKWAIVATNPVRMLGTLWGESFYVHKRINHWSRLTVTSHINVSESMIDTYRFAGSRYHKFGGSYEASAYRGDFPRSLLRVEPLCNSNYTTGSIKK